MKIIILLLHIFTTLVMPSKICFQPPCSVENEVADGFDEALKFCEKKGPMEMPFYGSQSQFYGICETDGGPNPGKPCIFPFIWQDKTYNGCPVDPYDKTKYWCSTKVDSNGNPLEIQSEYGYCSRNCPIQFHDQYGTQVYQCHTLLQQGPCEPNHWFVENKIATTPFADCERRKCEEGEMYFNNGCHKDDSDICGETQVLILNHFGEGECHTLLEQGPCQRNHWLVANDFETTHFADCKRRLCQEGEIHFNNECHKNDSNTVCGESQILLLNLFGKGECHCQNDFLEHYDKKGSLHCYEENSQGPCEVGKVFVQPDEEDKNGVPEDEQIGLNCYIETSRGWTDEAGKVLIQPDEGDPKLSGDIVLRVQFISSYGFEIIKCKRGSRPDAKGRCRPTNIHGRNRPCDLKCLRKKRKNLRPCQRG